MANSKIISDSAKENIETALATILNDEELISEFMKIDDIDEMYEFCLGIKAGYTTSEFYIYLEKFSEEVADIAEIIEAQRGAISELSDEDMDDIAGGVSAFNKFLSGSLAAVSLFTSTGIANAADENKVNGGNNAQSQIVQTINLSEDKKSEAAKEGTQAAEKTDSEAVKEGSAQAAEKTDSEAVKEGSTQTAEKTDGEAVKEGSTQAAEKTDGEAVKEGTQTEGEEEEEEEISEKNKKSVAERIRKNLKKAGKFVWKHKLEFTLGGLAIAGAVAGAGVLGYGAYRMVKKNNEDINRDVHKVTKADIRRNIKLNEEMEGRENDSYTKGMAVFNAQLDDLNKAKKDAINKLENSDEYKKLSDENKKEKLSAIDSNYSGQIEEINNRMLEVENTHNEKLKKIMDTRRTYGEQLKMTSRLNTLTEKANQYGAVAGGAATLVAAGASGLGTVITKGFGLMEGLSAKAKQLINITGALRPISDIVRLIKTNWNNVKNENEKRQYSIEEKRAQLVEDLKLIKGQKTAKDEILNQFDAIIEKREMAKHTGQELRPTVIILNGSAGIGKTMMAKALSKALNTSQMYEMSAADVKSTRSSDYMETLFKVGSAAPLSFITLENRKPTLGAFIQTSPQGAAIINEYDKVGETDGTGNKHPLDEVLRKVMDDGKVPNGDQDPIDVSGFTFILTTNETSKSLGLLPSPDDRDPTRTDIRHDQSFLTRLNVIELKQLDTEAYEEIAKEQFKKPFEYYAKNKCEFELDKEEFYKKIAKFTADKHQGARPIERLNLSFIGQVSALRSSIVKSDFKKYRKLVLKLDFNEKAGKFKIDILSKHKLQPGAKLNDNDMDGRMKDSYKEAIVENLKGACGKLGVEWNGKNYPLKIKYNSKKISEKIYGYCEKEGYVEEYIKDKLAFQFTRELSDALAEYDPKAEAFKILRASISADFNEETGKFEFNIK